MSTRSSARVERLMLLVLLGPIWIYAGFVILLHPSGRWRAQYYDTKDFSGKPIDRVIEDVAFRMSYRPPVQELSNKDYFSARFQTCLVLKDTTELAVQLVSDDGSRLFIDGELVLDKWSAGERRTRGRRLTLSAGVHPLKLEYFQSERQALLALNASFRGEVPRAIPAVYLALPAASGSCE